MSRAASSKSKIISLIIAAIIVLAGLGSWAYVASRPEAAKTQPTSSSVAQKPITEISYQGQSGVDALSLLKRHAKITTKHYSFGDQVVSINGVNGNGPKYWTFYLNGKMASQGAGSYVTKNSDKISWRLQ